MESQVNYKTQPFWVKVVHLVPNDHTVVLAGHIIVAIRLAPMATYPPFQHSTKNQVFILALDFL